MRKTCVQPVLSTRLTRSKVLVLPTHDGSTHGARRINRVVLHPPLHTFIMQLYPAKNTQITEAFVQLSTLSTPPIIRAKQVQKENNSLRTRG